MIEKKQLLEKIDEAIKSDKTSSDNKELLEKVKLELIDAQTKDEYSKVALKLIEILGAIAKFGTAIAKIFAGSG